MSENRWNGILSRYHNEIYSLGSPFGVLWKIAAHEIILANKDAGHILELGCGDGRSALPLIEKMDAHFTLVDESENMLDRVWDTLRDYRHRITRVRKDALAYLHDGPKFDVIYASHFIHNLPRVEKVYLFTAIHRCLNEGGLFVLVDQVSRVGFDDAAFFKRQMTRYRYLPVEASHEIYQHMKQDLSRDYIIRDTWLRRKLRSAGFREIRFVDHIERETLVIATK